MTDSSKPVPNLEWISDTRIPTEPKQTFFVRVHALPNDAGYAVSFHEWGTSEMTEDGVMLGASGEPWKCAEDAVTEATEAWNHPKDTGLDWFTALDDTEYAQAA